jgi:competence protein ComFA
MLFYVLIDAGGRLNFSPAPEVDKLLAGRRKYLSPGLPLGLLQHYLKDLTGLLDSANSPREVEKIVLTRVAKGLEKDKLALEQPAWQENSVFHSGPERCRELDDYHLYSRFIKLVEGKQFAEGERAFLAKELEIEQDKVLYLMHKAVLENRASWVPALHRRQSTWKCVRCGSEKCREWPSIFGKSATCLGCESMGALNSLQVLLRFKMTLLAKDSESQPGKFNSNQKQNKKYKYNYNYNTQLEDAYFQFTPAQSRAAKELRTFFETAQLKEALVWAACGAGKTEICFPLISQYLEEGKKVLFAAPRQDVVHDVHRRLQKNFPQYRVKLLSGAVPTDLVNSLLTVATTHQVLRFYRAFDLIIFDELDAYPYAGNDVLKYGMEQALKEDGRIVYLSATPSEEILVKVNKKTCSLISLPARYHGQPLPVPEIIKINLPEKNTSELFRFRNPSCLTQLRVICKELLLQGALLVFVPTVAMVSQWVKVFREMFEDKRVEGSWGADPGRRDKISSFRSGKIEVFVSTSILERGVTINGVQVIVLYAHHELYDVRTLVQMAGRTGRTAQCPGGRAIYLAPKKTKPMRAALDWITKQNALAREGGFLDV